VGGHPIRVSEEGWDDRIRHQPFTPISHKALILLLPPGKTRPLPHCIAFLRPLRGSNQSHRMARIIHLNRPLPSLVCACAPFPIPPQSLDGPAAPLAPGCSCGDVYLAHSPLHGGGGGGAGPPDAPAVARLAVGWARVRPSPTGPLPWLGGGGVLCRTQRVGGMERLHQRLPLDQPFDWD